MSNTNLRSRNRAFIIAGLGVSLLIAVLLSPFASQDPDGLDRVAQDLKFEEKATEETAAKKLPFYQVFDEYAARGVPEAIATPIAGLVGTLVTFGLAWGVGKLVVRRHDADSERDEQVSR
ncbi:MAG TPA: cobalt transport protein [Cyanobacteria bacterium UBA11369]|nr:cobalt transport protein [Cyanobacteria bacterium UBA11371]HBE33985.1 cobalt transport protein [Cyanobacteria bacterium UBA11368]HBE51271.1 cobalt transport protein [Cyanobacteria bacterium UBA11369]